MVSITSSWRFAHTTQYHVHLYNEYQPNDEKNEKVHVFLPIHHYSSVDDFPKCIQYVLDDYKFRPADRPQSIQKLEVQREDGYSSVLARHQA